MGVRRTVAITRGGIATSEGIYLPLQTNLCFAFVYLEVVEDIKG